MMSLQTVKANIQEIFAIKRVAQVEALDRYYAALVLDYFRSIQPPAVGQGGSFWNNQTGQAARRVFSRAFREGFTFGWLLAHGVNYGVYLELANDKRNSSLWPIIRKFAGRYFSDLRRLFEG